MPVSSHPPSNLPTLAVAHAHLRAMEQTNKSLLRTISKSDLVLQGGQEALAKASELLSRSKDWLA